MLIPRFQIIKFSELEPEKTFRFEGDWWIKDLKFRTQCVSVDRYGKFNSSNYRPRQFKDSEKVGITVLSLDL